MSPRPPEISSSTVHRLSLYLQCLRGLMEEGTLRVSSQELARRFHLSAPQIRKDLAQFGELGIRGVGYEVPPLIEHLEQILGLDRRHRLLVVGMGNLGQALSRYLGFNEGSFQVVAGVDNDPDKVGLDMGTFTVRDSRELAAVVKDSRAEIGVLTVPAESAQGYYDALVAAGIRGVLNFAPARVTTVPEVPLKNVELRVFLEEMAFLIRE